tara:strand:+ start:1457 stop:2557 length:1101 start_codon:yes stop_codon:yes gene_type:complete
MKRVFDMRYVVRALLFAPILCVATAFAHDALPDSNRRVVNTEMVARVEVWLSLLTEQQHKLACFSFKSDERLNWHFIPRERLGLPLKAMNLQQRRAAYALLQTGLSHQGYLKATTIMSLESVLRELETDRPDNEDRRDPEKYWFSVFGTPSETEPWGWRLEGHHVSINFSSVSGAVAAATPLFLGASPAEIRTGPRAGQRVLASEEDMARKLIVSLQDNHAKKSVISSDAPDEVLTVPDASLDLGVPQGVSEKEMTPVQQVMFRRLIEQIIRTLRGELADDVLTEISENEWKELSFAWAGSFEQGRGHYYRIQCPSFIIEYDNTQNEANHAHIVWHSLENNFGLDALRRHYESQHGQPQASVNKKN